MKLMPVAGYRNTNPPMKPSVVILHFVLWYIMWSFVSRRGAGWQILSALDREKLRSD